MKYYEDMRTKWGFGDGEAVPDGVEHYRAVYITAINKVAKEKGSKLEAWAFDRGGMHNWCLLLFRPVGSTEHVDVIDCELDQPMQDAIASCYLAQLDDVVTAKISLPRDWKQRIDKQLNQ